MATPENARYEAAVSAIDAASTIARLGKLSAAITERTNAGKFTADESNVLFGLILRRAFVLGGIATPPEPKPRKTRTARIDETTGATKTDFPF